VCRVAESACAEGAAESLRPNKPTDRALPKEDLGLSRDIAGSIASVLLHYRWDTGQVGSDSEGDRRSRASASSDSRGRSDQEHVQGDGLP
jgi:hypothetical protein